jgi:hypothetical protein
MADYSEHREVKRLRVLENQISHLRGRIRDGYLDPMTVDEFNQILKDTNITFNLTQVRKLKRMIRNDSPVVLQTNFDGEVDVYLTLTKTKLILLLMEELNDILESRIAQVKSNFKPVRRERKAIDILNSGF